MKEKLYSKEVYLGASAEAFMKDSGNYEVKFLKLCKCGGLAKSHYDNGLYCGDGQCDKCFNKMIEQCRQRSW